MQIEEVEQEEQEHSSSKSKLGLASFWFLLAAMATYTGAHVGHQTKGDRTDYRYEAAGAALGLSGLLVITAIASLIKCLCSSQNNTLSNHWRYTLLGEPATTNITENGLINEETSETRISPV